MVRLKHITMIRPDDGRANKKDSVTEIDGQSEERRAKGAGQKGLYKDLLFKNLFTQLVLLPFLSSLSSSYHSFIRKFRPQSYIFKCFLSKKSLPSSSSFTFTLLFIRYKRNPFLSMNDQFHFIPNHSWLAVKLSSFYSSLSLPQVSVRMNF